MKSDRGIKLAGRSLLDSQLMFLPRISMICWVMLSFFMGPVIITPGFSLRFFPSSQMKIRVQQWSNPAICAWFTMESLYFYISIFPMLSHILLHVSGTFSIFQPYFSHFPGILWNGPEHKVLVFVSQKQYADELATKLWDAGFKATAMHGGKSQDGGFITNGDMICTLWL
jgi:hypothetical protein